MSILIKGMEMPKSCPCELIGVGYDLYCSFAVGVPARVKEYYECCDNGTRPDWCPLTEVPEPHGNLIDADALLKEAEVPATLFPSGRGSRLEVWTHAVALGDVINAPTIIEAESCKEEGE